MMKEAAETLVPKSPASCGSIGSTQRREIPALNAASARSRIASRGLASLGRKPLDAPGTVHAAAGARIEQAVVQAIRASLPELDLARRYAIAAPVRRARRRIAVAAARLGHRGLQRSTRRNALALRRGPGGKARTQRATREICIGIVRLDALHGAVDAHLALELGPDEDQAGGAACLELARLAAAVVRVEDEAGAFDAFQEHDAGRRRPGGIDRGERHRIGQRQ